MYTNAIYYPSHTVYTGTTPAGLNYACINLVYYAFAKVTEAGHVFVRIPKHFLLQSKPYICIDPLVINTHSARGRIRRCPNGL